MQSFRMRTHAAPEKHFPRRRGRIHAGIWVMFLSEATEAIRLVMTQVLLVGLKFHPSECGPRCKFFCVGFIMLHPQVLLAGGAQVPPQ